MSKKTIFYIIFFSALVLVFYFIITLIIPDFGKKNYPSIGSVQPFAFINQNGNAVTEKDVQGKVFVAEYFFTTCKSICPRMNMNMRTVYEKFKNESGFLILSHTSDPATDSAARLKKYADSLGVSGKNWIFLTGRKDSLYNMARYSYKIDDPNNNLKSIDEDFLHSQFFALVNKKGEVRKIYDGLKPSEVDAMILEIEKFLKE
jgi:protein SCO1/2